jgi:hypothetical protein
MKPSAMLLTASKKPQFPKKTQRDFIVILDVSNDPVNPPRFITENFVHGFPNSQVPKPLPSPARKKREVYFCRNRSYLIKTDCPYRSTVRFHDKQPDLAI